MGDEKLKAMANCCGAFLCAVKGGSSPRWLSLLGTTGTGKTHCATRVWDWMRVRIDWSPYVYLHSRIYWPQFISELRAGIGYEQLREMARWPVLYLDDIGAERDKTGFAAEQLNTLLGCRTEKWTILTSNLLLHQLAAIDPRIADRIIRGKGNQFVEVTSPSYATRKLTTNPI